MSFRTGSTCTKPTLETHRSNGLSRLPILATLVGMTLAGCAQSPAELAERRYEMVKKQGDPAATCAAARAVEAAYLESLDQKQYRRWSLAADIDCNRALLDSLS